MNIVLLTSVFPNRYQPTKGIFNLNLARALAREHQVRVVSPVSWVLTACSRRTRDAFESETGSGLTIEYVPYYYPPKMLRQFYGSFLWHSIQWRLRRMLRESPPDIVVGYWLHPDGDAALRVARTANVPAVMLV